MNFSKLKTISKYYWSKFLALLRVSTVVGGMEISDNYLRFAYFDGRNWKTNSARLEHGVMEGGKIKDYAKFVEALKTLKEKVFGKRDVKKRISAVVSLSSINIYSQVFSLPIIEGENLDKAIQLNVQMVSPVEAAQAYSGWQLVGRDQDALRLEILSAFIERGTVDEVSRALFDGGFLIVALESRALALSRVFREQGGGVDPDRSYIMMSIDGSGIDFLIIRRGQLYFEYFNPWRDIMDEGGQVSMDMFKAAVLRSLHQVMNFYGQHWSDAISGVVLSATALGDEAAAIIGENFSLPVGRLRLKAGDMSPDWYIALGCSLRGLLPRGEDKELSLLGIGAEEEFRREQLVSFLKFWRLAAPVALGILIITFFLADLFLIQTRKSLDLRLLTVIPTEQITESETLLAEAREFNAVVSMIRSVQENYLQKNRITEKIVNFMDTSRLSLTDLGFQSAGQPITLSGRGSSEDQILSFRRLLEDDPQFVDINLPITGIVSEAGVVSFSMTFRLAQ